jgi:hypothetical protein
MPQRDSFILMGAGGFFIILGLAALLWGRREEKGYYDAMAARPDVREYLEHSPERPEPGSPKVGGWISLAIGLLMLALGGAFLLWG